MIFEVIAPNSWLNVCEHGVYIHKVHLKMYQKTASAGTTNQISSFCCPSASTADTLKITSMVKYVKVICAAQLFTFIFSTLVSLPRRLCFHQH